MASCRRRLATAVGVGAALLALAATAAHAEVRVSRRADGTLVVHNDGSPGRRESLRAVPPAEVEGWIQVHSRRHDLDPKLVQAVIQVESAYRPRAVSVKGAMGLMQLMPETARQLAVPDAFDPDHNIRGGCAYLRRMLDEFGTLELALAAYNAGPAAVRRYSGVPPYRETRDYVRRVLTLYRGVAPELPPARQPAASAPPASRGRRVFLLRDGSNRVVMTTSPVAG